MTAHTRSHLHSLIVCQSFDAHQGFDVRMSGATDERIESTWARPSRTSLMLATPLTVHEGY